MTAKLCIAMAFAALTAPAFTADPRPPIPTPAADQGYRTSTLEDQAELSVTVYNSDIALIRDVRNLTLARGISDLRFMDIAATVNPATVHFRSLSDAARVAVLEQNYEYDLLEPEKLLRKYIGRDVTLVRMRQAGGSTVEEETKAHLLSFNGAPVWRIGNEIVTGMTADHIRFPELPESLFSRPTLIWTLENSGITNQRVEASYLARRLSWSSDYVLTVGRDERMADIDGWVTLTNGSGTALKNARLQLVAGELNRVRAAMELASARSDLVDRAKSAEAPPMSEEAFSEYHLYTVGRATSINNSETKQIRMLGGSAVPVTKRFVVNGQNYYYRNAQNPGSPLRDTVQVFYQFKNDERSGLGMPMPAGIIRVYQQDARGGTQFVGEDRIAHTPKDELLNLKIGNAFDVVAERKQLSFTKIATNVYEMEYEVTLRNHKPLPISVEVNEPLGGSWTMLRATHEWTKTDAWAARFNVPVRPDSESVVRYRVRITY